MNKSFNAKRKRARRNEAPIDDPRVVKAIAVDAWGDPAQAAELRQTYTRLLQALDNLPSEMCTTVVLVALQGMSHMEASIIQDCPTGTIAWRIHKARQRLHQALIVRQRPRNPTPSFVAELSPELDLLLQRWGLPA